VALLMGPGIPAVNVMTVAVHSRWGEGQNPSLRGVGRSLLTNPLLVACVLGLAINLSGLELPPSVMDVLAIIGRGALGVTLMCVGAGLDLKAWEAALGPAMTAITEQAALRERLRVRATPTWFVDGYRLAGLQSPESIGGVIGRELEDLQFATVPPARLAGGVGP
jgi:hypothetical protein